jgi:3-oxoadipate enol-lactonase
MKTLRLGSFTTAVADSGGDKPALVLAHAVGTNMRMWQAVTPRLVDDFRIVTFDIRGHGRAAGAPPARDLDDFAADLLELLDALDLRRVHLAGLSFGGAVAQQFALRCQNRLESLTLIATMAKAVPALLDRAIAAERDGVQAQVEPTLARWFTPAAIAQRHWGVEYAREALSAMRLGDWSAAWRAVATLDTADRLGEITVPTHVIAGELDGSTPPDAMRGLAARIPGANFDVVPRAPHMLGLEQPGPLAETMLARLKSKAR